MSNSSLIAFEMLSPNCNPRVNSKYNPTGAVTKITIHHAAGKLTAKRLCEIFSPTSRNASANYCIGYDGTIALCVPEDKRAWTSSSALNDYNAITIEVANDSGSPNWTISDASMSALIKLCADICSRNNIKELKWTGTKEGNLTCHYMFAATACPGPYLKGKMSYIAEQVNSTLVVKEEPPVKENKVSTSKYSAGTAIELKDANLYSTATSTRRANTKTGTFYLWSSEVINDRIRITNSKDNVGKTGQVTGFINISDINVRSESAPAKLSAQQLAENMKAGMYGNGEERKQKLRSLGYTDAEIQAAQNIVNGGKTTTSTSSSVTINDGDLVKFKSSATKWATGQKIPNWVKLKTLYVRSKPVDGKCQVSTGKTGAITGIALVKDLNKV